MNSWKPIDYLIFTLACAFGVCVLAITIIATQILGAK